MAYKFEGIDLYIGEYVMQENHIKQYEYFTFNKIAGGKNLF
jgi:hypothetical protein